MEKEMEFMVELVIDSIKDMRSRIQAFQKTAL